MYIIPTKVYFGCDDMDQLKFGQNCPIWVKNTFSKVKSSLSWRSNWSAAPADIWDHWWNIIGCNGHKPVKLVRWIFVDTLFTVGTAQRVPRVDNTDERHTAADRQNWTGVEPLKHRLISLLSDIPFTVYGALLYRSLTSSLLLCAMRRV